MMDQPKGIKQLKNDELARQIEALRKKHTNAVGFIPMKTLENRYIEKSRYIVILEGEHVVGYLLHGAMKAGCPSQVCSKCGAPYKRVTECTPMEIRRSSRSEAMGDFGRTCTSGSMTKPPTVTTLGFAPTCDCDAPTRPGIVYDPFMGSGTTALVAQRLGRHFIGTDINSEYVELARDRLRYCGDDKRMVKEMDKYKRK